MLILLSSSARRRYHDDIVRALAHPEGTAFRFRYGNEYVEQSVLDMVSTEDLNGTSALVCHLADPAGSSASLVPCRFVKIERAQLVGTSVVLTLSAGSFVQGLDDQSLRAEMTVGELAQIPNQSSNVGTPSGKFAFHITKSLDANIAPRETAVEAFEATTDALNKAGFNSPHPTPFYTVLDVKSISSVSAIASIVVVEEGRYNLRSGKRYSVEVYSYGPASDVNPSDASTMAVGSDEVEVRFSSDRTAKLDSRYDLNRFTFSTEQRLFTLPAGLRFALNVPVDEDGKTIEDRCDITLELRFTGSLALAAGRVAMIALGTALPAIIGAYAAEKGSIGLAVAMLAAALLAGVATVFPALKKN